MTRDPHQIDLFLEPLFPVREAAPRIDLDRYRAKMKRAMAKAIRECPHDRPTIAARMAAYLGVASITKTTLDAYTAESKAAHDITLPRFAAFVQATGALWLWDEAISDQGATLLIGDEARLAEIAHLQQEQAELRARLKSLQSRPVHIRRKG